MSAILDRRIASLGLLWVSLLSGAGFDSSRWQFQTPARIHERGRLCVIPFDRTMYSRMRQDFADLRVVKDGEEIPYVIETLTASVEQKECNPGILDKSVKPGTGVQITLDLGACPDLKQHSRIEFTTTETNFRQQVRIETSDDNRLWLIAREDGYIFDFTQGDTTLSALTVDYPVSTRRYVRGTILGWMNPGAITGGSAAYRLEHAAERYILDVNTPDRVEDSNTRTSILTIDLGQIGLPHDSLRLETDRSDFHRGVELEASNDRKTWSPVTRGTIFQVSLEQSLSLSYSERHDRYLRLRIFNGNNHPVPIVRTFVETEKRLFKFLPPADGDVWVYYGNPSAKPPVYDLAAILTRQAPIPETRPTIGEWKVNPDYRPQAEPDKPWSDRHPSLLYGVLGLAVIGMGLVTVRFLMKVKDS